MKLKQLAFLTFVIACATGSTTFAAPIKLTIEYYSDPAGNFIGTNEITIDGKQTPASVKDEVMNTTTKDLSVSKQQITSLQLFYTGGLYNWSSLSNSNDFENVLNHIGGTTIQNNATIIVSVQLNETNIEENSL